MTKDKHKKKKKKTDFYSVFAPVYPNVQGTPKTNYSSQNINGGGSHSGGSSGGMSMGMGGGGIAGGIHASVIPPSRRKVIHEIRQVLGYISEGETQMTNDPAWKGYSAPSPALTMRPGGPQPRGSGFSPVAPGQGGRYDFQRSPGLGFTTEKAWRTWAGIVDILGKRPNMPIHQLMQAAMARAGVKFGDIAPQEQRLLEMGIQWYLSDPRATQSATSSGGGQSGIGSDALNSRSQ
jgi:hypothetical protein